MENEKTQYGYTKSDVDIAKLTGQVEVVNVQMSNMVRTIDDFKTNLKEYLKSNESVKDMASKTYDIVIIVRDEMAIIKRQNDLNTDFRKRLEDIFSFILNLIKIFGVGTVISAIFLAIKSVIKQ